MNSKLSLGWDKTTTFKTVGTIIQHMFSECQLCASCGGGVLNKAEFYPLRGSVIYAWA